MRRIGSSFVGTWLVGGGIVPRSLAGSFVLLSLAATTTIPRSTAFAASFVTTDQLGVDPANPVVFWGLSGDGRTVVGQRSQNADPVNEAILWNAEHGFLRLGLLPGGASESYALSASFDGSQVVGASDTTIDVPDPAGGTSTPIVGAFVWDEDSGLVDLDGGLPDESRPRWAQARSVSADGRTFVGSHLVRTDEQSDPDAPILSNRDYDAVVWREGEGYRRLGTLETERGPWFGDYHGSFANDVSADGAIVVGTSDTSVGREAFVWDEVRGMRGLGRLSGAEPGYSEASAISADGSTIVGVDVVLDDDLRNSRQQGFIFSEATGIQRLPGLVERWIDVDINGVSGDGSIVIGTGRTAWSSTGETSEAFVWDADHGARTLKDLLASLGIDLPGWRLTNAFAVSDDGRTIIGAARDAEDQFQSFIAVIPEPGTAVLFGLGVAGLAGWRNGFRR